MESKVKKGDKKRSKQPKNQNNSDVQSYGENQEPFLWSPDSDYDINPAIDYSSKVSQPSERILLKAYDGTNGTISDGDIYRVKQ